MLAPYATDPRQSRGRLVKESDDPLRSCFQRDRDRIIHSSAFRRLKHKTQVFLENEGDYFRTRLTHTIEVSQVARTLANALDLEIDLSESIALAHDLGHPPFGHTGEEALNNLMSSYGGFDHNTQSILILTSLERHYARWDGLNLTWEVLEGLAKHNGPLIKDIPKVLSRYSRFHDLNLHSFPSAEAQVAAISDDIAYNHHDVLDGIRAGFFNISDLKKLPILSECFYKAGKSFPKADELRIKHEALRSFFNFLVLDVIEQSNLMLEELSPRSVSDIRNANYPVVQFSASVIEKLNTIRSFLFVKMYRAPSIMDMRAKVTKIVDDLFCCFMEQKDILPIKWQNELREGKSEQEMARIVVNYISGMTDRFAIKEHNRLVEDGRL
ncbi:MAG: deoxyguanosinetriphosphate triphosphohydrolase [Paracoccaceae bacterium]